MEPADIDSANHDMETLEIWLDDTSNKLLEISLLLEQSMERLDETLKRLDGIKQDYTEQGFARLSVQENIERSRAKRPFTRCEQDSLREKHDTVLHMVEVVTRSLQEKLNSSSRQRPKETSDTKDKDDIPRREDVTRTSTSPTRNSESNSLRFTSDQSNVITDSLFISSFYVGKN